LVEIRVSMTRPNRRIARSSNQRILAIDVGAGTQDILIYDPERPLENCFKLVLPSQTQIVSQRIRNVTSEGLPLHLTGVTMGGGASSSAIIDHLAAGLALTAEREAARTLHNDLDRVRRMGVRIGGEPAADAIRIDLADVDISGLRSGLAAFGVDLPSAAAIAVQDHGYRPGSGNNEVRFEFLQSLLDGGGDLSGMAFQAAPAGMTRMEAVLRTWPGAVVMDTGAAAVLGSLGDPAILDAVGGPGAILINVGNMHTFATLIRDDRLYGHFEHHSGGITPEVIARLVNGLRAGTLDPDSFTEQFDGHGAAYDPAYRDLEPFQFVAITGPHRHIAAGLGFHEAAPYGDMMLTGAFGLVEAALRLFEEPAST
jgi:uncharacterized protein (DUF1786 family)